MRVFRRSVAEGARLPQGTPVQRRRCAGADCLRSFRDSQHLNPGLHRGKCSRRNGARSQSHASGGLLYLQMIDFVAREQFISQEEKLRVLRGAISRRAPAICRCRSLRRWRRGVPRDPRARAGCRGRARPGAGPRRSGRGHARHGSGADRRRPPPDPQGGGRER